MPREKAHVSGAVRRERLCIVVACEDAAEAAHVGSIISQVNTGTLVTYRQAQDVLLNRPAGKVVLIILATAESTEAIRETLAWLRRRWPHCPVTVIGDRGGGELEIAARAGGAAFLTRPVSPSEWAAMIHHALRMEAGRVATEVELG